MPEVMTVTTGTLSTSSLIDLYDAAILDGGFTVRYGGDGSFEPAEAGYAVSATSRQYAVSADVSFTDFMRAVEDLHALFPTADALGGWVDHSRLYLDPVEIHTDRATAVRLGSMRQQIAIYDLGNAEEIRL